MAAQQAALLVAEIGAGMERAAVVPEDEIADAPFVRIDELILLDMVEQRVEQLGTLPGVHPLDRPGHQPVDVERLAAGDGMLAHHRLPEMRLLGKIDLGFVDRARQRFVVVGIDSFPALDARFQFRRQRVVGLVHVEKERVAAARGNLDGVEERALGRLFEITIIGVEIHFAVGQRADELAVLADVGHQHREVAMLDTGFVAGRRWPVARFQNTEMFCEADLLVLGQFLISEHDHEVPMPGVEDGRDRLRRWLFPQVDAEDFGAQGG